MLACRAIAVRPSGEPARAWGEFDAHLTAPPLELPGGPTLEEGEEGCTLRARRRRRAGLGQRVGGVAPRSSDHEARTEGEEGLGLGQKPQRCGGGGGASVTREGT